MLQPAVWPQTPGFESAPLRWRSETLDVFAYAVESDGGALAFLLLESDRAPAGAFGSLLRALHAGQRLLKTQPPAEIVRTIQQGEPHCGVTAARWDGSRLTLESAGAPIPHVLRAGRPLPFEIAEQGPIRTAICEAAKGDLLLLSSRGVDEVLFATKPEPPEKTAQSFARAAEGRPLNAAFSQIVSEWKLAGALPGRRDVFFLAARRT